MFRREKEHLFISDYLDAAAYRERGDMKGIDSLFEYIETLQAAN